MASTIKLLGDQFDGRQLKDGTDGHWGRIAGQVTAISDFRAANTRYFSADFLPMTTLEGLMKGARARACRARPRGGRQPHLCGVLDTWLRQG